MCKNIIVFTLFLLVAAHLITVDAGRTSSRSSNSGYRRGGYYGSQAPPPTQPPPETPKEYLDKRSGFSTFGIISIIFVAIVICLVFYYGIMCYPFLCRDEKMKYNYGDVSSTITTATSRSSIENYPVDQKH